MLLCGYAVRFTYCDGYINILAACSPICSNGVCTSLACIIPVVSVIRPA